LLSEVARTSILPIVTWTLGSGSAASAGEALRAFSLADAPDPEFIPDAAFFICAISSLTTLGGSTSPRLFPSKDSSLVGEAPGGSAGARFGAPASKGERKSERKKDDG
jgi:hypothetical protein